MKFLVKLHNELGDNTLTHSLWRCLDPLIPPRFNHIDCHQCLFCLLLQQWYRPTQSSNIQCGTYIPLFRSFWILTDCLQFNIWLMICLAVIFTVIWMVQVAFPVEPIVSIWNACRWTTVITFGGMTVNSFDLADIQSFSLSSMEVLCRQTGCHRWSF